MTLALFLYLTRCQIRHWFGRHTFVKGIREDVAWCVVCRASQT